MSTSLPVGESTPTNEFTKLKIMKNLFVLSGGVMLLFTAHDGMSMLQSTMNREHGIGVGAGAIGYGLFCVSALLFPKYTIKKFGSKTTNVLSMCSIIPYLACNFHPQWSVMIPAVILVGFGGPLLWGAQATYLKDLSVIYAKLLLNTKRRSFVENSCHFDTQAYNSTCDYEAKRIRTDLKVESNIEPLKADKNELERQVTVALSRTLSNGISHQGHEANCGMPALDKTKLNAPSCLDSSTSLRSFKEFGNIDASDSNSCENYTSKDNLERTLVIESTTAWLFGIHGMSYLSSHLWGNLITYFILRRSRNTERNSSLVCVCGVDYCNVASACFEHNIEQPNDSVRYTLTAVCLCISVAAVLLLICFLDPLQKGDRNVRFSLEYVLATYRIATRKEALLLLPCSLFVGMAQGFYAGDFNKAFVGCAWGAYHVGLVAICYGTFSGISSSCTGLLVKKIGRLPVFTFAVVVEVSALIILLSWKPTSQESYIFFVSAAMLGVFVGAFWSQLRAFHGILFKGNEEAAFGAFHVWYSLGFSLSFAYSNFLCTWVKLYLQMTLCIAGYIGYFSVEKMYSKQKCVD